MSNCYVIATPIGNLQDITERAVEVLKSVDSVFAEDTRVSGRLLSHFGIKVPLTSLHEHNEMSRFEKIQSLLDDNKSVAIISDAGTPLISDPGFTVVRMLREKGYKVIPIPGVSAIITALSVAGIATDRFTFIGFLPSKKGQRREELGQLESVPHTLIFYESSHRILAMLEDLKDIFGESRPIFVGREMTKHFEDYRFGSAQELYQYYCDHDDQIRGEFVVVTAGKEDVKKNSSGFHSEALIKALMAENLPLKQISSIVHQVTGESKNSLYQALLQSKNEEQA